MFKAILRNIYFKLMLIFKQRQVFVSESGQGSVEFAIVLTALLVIVVTLSLFANIGEEGLLVQHAISSASHNLQEAAAGAIGDIFCF